MLLRLPSELRCRVYEVIFQGRRLRWQATSTGLGSTNTAESIELLLVSRAVHDESKAVMLKSAQIDVSTMINHCRQRGQTSPPFDISIVRHLFYQCAHAPVSPPAMLAITETVSNLVSLTFAHVPTTVYYILDAHKKIKLSDSDVEFVRRHPWRILGGSSEWHANSHVPFDRSTKDLIDIWEHRARSFNLVSELSLYNMRTLKAFAVSISCSGRCVVLQLIPLQKGYYDLGTKTFKVVSVNGAFEPYDFFVDITF